MIDYREIIRLKSLKFSNVAIANSLCCSRNTVSEVLKLAGSHSLEWPVPDTLTNNDIEHLFYPDRGTNEGRRLPDYEYVYNELAKPGVTLSLLWAEYCAKCEAEHTIPYQHTQFNEKYHAYAASKKAMNNPVPVSLLSGDRGSSAIIRYYCYIPCTSTLLQATACHIFHTLYVLSFLICY